MMRGAAKKGNGGGLAGAPSRFPRGEGLLFPPKEGKKKGVSEQFSTIVKKKRGGRGVGVLELPEKESFPRPGIRGAKNNGNGLTKTGDWGARKNLKKGLFNSAPRKREGKETVSEGPKRKEIKKN